MADVPAQDTTGEHDPVAQIRREFSAGLPARVERMRSALDAVAHGYDAAMAETFYHAAHSLNGTAASFGAHELVDHAAFLAELGRCWLRVRAVTAEQLSSASGELERLRLAVEQYRARIERSDAK
jgi:HPt (histidine-containing phosphotransfer) domain-containing protein